jgi:predicted TPR repeat methyltransferase
MHQPPDPRARRRLEIGLAFRREGDVAAAVDAIRAAIEIAPGDAEAWHALGEALEMQGAAARDAAIEAYRGAVARDPSDRMGATIRLALLGADDAPPRLPDAYVRTLFDQYAPRFDSALEGRLGYRAPALLREAVGDRAGIVILDLGCGTGLAGVAFADLAQVVDGVDLSPAMIARARARGIYRRLEAAEIVGWLAACEQRYDLAVAADVLVYIGDLAPVFAAVRRVLAPGGRFAFTVERLDDGDGWRLGPQQRYAHAPAYVEAVAGQAGFAAVRAEPVSARSEKSVAVPGLLVVLEAP